MSFVIEPSPPTPYSTLYFDVSGTEGRDAVTTSYDGRRFDVSSSRALAASGYCRKVSPTGARCHVPRVNCCSINIEFRGHGGDDQISFSQPGEYPSVLAAFMEGGAGDDRLVSGSGFDYLLGGAGQDVLMSQGGPDYVRGGPGADDLRCGSRRDRYRSGSRDRVRSSCEDGV